MLPADLTPSYLADVLTGELWVWCPTCRAIRRIDLFPLKLLRGSQRIGDMMFTCQVCGDAGHPQASWHDHTGKWSFDFVSGELKDAGLPSLYS